MTQMPTAIQEFLLGFHDGQGKQSTVSKSNWQRFLVENQQKP